MRKFLSLFIILCTTLLSAVAQNSDSVRLVTAPRESITLPKGAEGYTVKRVNIFSSTQTISVIRYSPRHFSTAIVLPKELSHLSATAIASGADFGVNAGYWDVTNSLPSTFLRIDGEQIAQTAEYEKERVDGLLCIGRRRVVIDACKAGEEASFAAKYEDILASGPLLIDEGKSVDHNAYTKNMVEAAHKKDIGAHYTYVRRHPRTAIGTDRKGKVYLVVVDGRSAGNADGVTIAELTKICEWLGLCDAINLDGGSSSTMWGKQAGVINHPSRNRKFDHEGERRVSSILSVKRR
ncbi:MAG: phosphodiester glycosidase family protein [Alistipes sp.]|nr:phosphodiester glycosidase family protein [Alistipes sp.]